MEDEVFAEQAQKAGLKVTEVAESWQSLPKLKQRFFASRLNKLLRRFQTEALMLPFLTDTIEEILRELFNQFILNSIIDGVVKT